MTNPTIWAFGGYSQNEENEDPEFVAKGRKEIYKSIRGGKSRFAWSQDDTRNLRGDAWTDEHSKQWFLLSIKPGDWIVHINIPEWGMCVAAQVTSEYGFDDGLEYFGGDFRHNISVDPATIRAFDRNDQNILPSVNLRPRGRYHRVYAVEEFLQSLENLRGNKVALGDDEDRGEYHLREKADSLLEQASRHIHEMHPGKKLERFLAKVLRRIPDIVAVDENGSRGGADHGADLIATVRSSIALKDSLVIVQVKSFDGEHRDTNAVDQIVQGIQYFKGAAGGMLITTGESTEDLERKAFYESEKLGKPIELLCGADVARFVVQHAPDLLFNLGGK